VLCLIAEDDLMHETVTYTHGHPGRTRHRTMTECGRYPELHQTGPVAEGEGCPVCLPDFAHPLAGIWAACRRFDADVNARACLEPPRFLERAS
jgi:hypothetical protein